MHPLIFDFVDANTLWLWMAKQLRHVNLDTSIEPMLSLTGHKHEVVTKR